jgi:DNA-binding NtrC family response regulator
MINRRGQAKLPQLHTKIMTSKQRALPNREVYPPATSWGSWHGTERSRATVVLIVDEDLGFLWWLGQMFNQAGCQVVPTLNSEQAASIVRDLKLEVDLIVVNPALACIPELIHSLSTSRSPKIVAIRNNDGHVQKTIRAHATLERPSGWAPVSEKEWLGSVRKLVKDIKLPSVQRSAHSRVLAAQN